MALAHERASVTTMQTSEMEEGTAVLVARAKDGDEAAVTLLYRRYVAPIYAYALQRLGDPESAEDVTQTVFLKAVVSLEQCRDDEAFAGWLFAIARNAVLDVHRTRRRTHDPLDPDDEQHEDPSPTPEDLVIQRERRETLEAARRLCLNDQERDLLDLLLSDLNDKEIATALGKRHGAVRTAHWRLLNKLRACLGLLHREKEAAHVAS